MTKERKAARKEFRPTFVEKVKLANIANTDGLLTPGARRVFTYLLDRHNPKVGRVFPSQKRIAKELGLTVRWVREASKLLSAMGYIHIARGAGPNGSSLYRFNMSKLSGRTASESAAEGSYNTEEDFRYVEEPDFREGRNSPSSELSNQLNQTNLRGADKRGATSAFMHVAPQSVSRLNRKRQIFQRRLVRTVGDHEQAYELLGHVPHTTLDDLRIKYETDEITIEDVARILQRGYGSTK